MEKLVLVPLSTTYSPAGHVVSGDENENPKSITFIVPKFRLLSDRTSSLL
jgi:hypothetical protein